MNYEQKIFDLFDECVAYVSSKIKKVDATFDEKEFYYINKFYVDKGFNLNKNVINDISTRIHGFIRSNVLAEERRHEKEMNEHRMADYQAAVNRARKEMINKVNKNVKQTRYEEMRNQKNFAPLLDEDFDNIWNEYVELWNEKHDVKKPTKPKAKTFVQQLNDYVAFHADDLLDFNAFKNLTKSWSRGTKTLEQWYEVYKEKFFEQPGTTIKYKETPMINIISGFKGKNKIEALMKLNHINEGPKVENTYFPLKDNIKRYQLHKASSRGTYLIDLMFCDKLCYLVAINVNSRYLYVTLTNIVVETNDSGEISLGKTQKTSILYLKALMNIIKEGANIKYLYGDSESAFNSNLSKEFYINNDIRFDQVPRMEVNVYPDFMKEEKRKGETEKKKKKYTDPNHSSLGIIDRVIRTIRDMAYNMKVGLITPNVMKEIVYQYNNVPHKTLSKYAHMNVTPNMVKNDPKLEEFIVKRIIQSNFNIQNRAGFELKEGRNVKVYNEKDSMNKRRSIIQPGNFIIESGFNNGMFKVKNINNGKTQTVPRYKLSYA